MPLLFVVTQDPAFPFLETSITPPMSELQELFSSIFDTSQNVPRLNGIYVLERSGLNPNHALDCQAENIFASTSAAQPCTCPSQTLAGED